MTLKNVDLVLVNEKLVENYFHALLYNNGVIELTWDESIDTIEVEHLNRAREVFYEFGGGQKMPIYFSTHAFLSVSDSARKLAATKEYSKYTLANAVFVESLAMKLLLNFFMNFNKPATLTKGFSNREAAMKWLESLKQGK